MKNTLTSLVAAALIAMPLVVTSTPASAQAQAAPTDMTQAPAKPKAKKAKKATPAKKHKKIKVTKK